MVKASTTRAIRTRLHLRRAAHHPRLSVFRSSAHIWAQVIDDQTGKTIASASSKGLSKSETLSKQSASKGTKLEKAAQVGQTIAQAALKKGVKQVVFDRGGCRFHGRVKALAEAARAAGLTI